MRIDFQDSAVLVVGGGGVRDGWGNGQATAVAFARANARIGVFDANAEAAHYTVEQILAEGGDAIPLVGNACSEDDLQAAVATLRGAYGPVSVMHHNVGIAHIGGALDSTLGQWQEVMQVNLTSLYLSTRAVLPDMLEHGRGVVTTVSSLAAVRWTGAPLLSYSVTKAGVIAFAQSIALEYARHNIRANAIVLGKVDTPMVYRTHGTLDSDQVAALRASRDASCPGGKMGSAWDTAAASVFLASDAARFITGTTLTVDGGLSARC